MAKLAGPDTERDGLTTHVVQGMRYYVLPLPLHMPRDCTVLRRMSAKYRQRVLAALHMVRHVPVEPATGAHGAGHESCSLDPPSNKPGTPRSQGGAAVCHTVHAVAREVKLTTHAVPVARIHAQ